MEKMILNSQRNVSLSSYLQNDLREGIRRPAVLVLPGGGYRQLSIHEAERIAWHYMAAGYHTFVLRYSVGEHRTWPNPLDDYEQAMETIRAHADEWGIYPDKIAVVGFSAGGHLAGCAATASKNRPNAAILGYAPLEKDLIQMLMPDGCTTLGPVEHVDEKTCPCFLFTARDDELVSVKNTVLFEQELIKYDIAFESHIYAFGGHGFGDACAPYSHAGHCKRLPRWVEDSIGWLEDIFGTMTFNGITSPHCRLRLNDNHEPFLSMDCTLKHLKEHPAASQLLADFFRQLDEGIITRYGELESFYIMYNNTRLSALLKSIGYTPAQIDALAQKIQDIPN